MQLTERTILELSEQIRNESLVKDRQSYENERTRMESLMSIAALDLKAARDLAQEIEKNSRASYVKKEMAAFLHDNPLPE